MWLCLLLLGCSCLFPWWGLQFHFVCSVIISKCKYHVIVWQLLLHSWTGGVTLILGSMSRVLFMYGVSSHPVCKCVCLYIMSLVSFPAIKPQLEHSNTWEKYGTLEHENGQGQKLSLEESLDICGFVCLFCLLKNTRITLRHAGLLPVLQDLGYFYTRYLFNKAC